MPAQRCTLVPAGSMHLLHASTEVHPCAGDYLVQCCGAISPQVVVQPFVQALWVLRVPHADGCLAITGEYHPTLAALGGGFAFGKIQAATCGQSQHSSRQLHQGPGQGMSCCESSTVCQLQPHGAAKLGSVLQHDCTVYCSVIAPAPFHHSQQYHCEGNLQVHKEDSY